MKATAATHGKARRVGATLTGVWRDTIVYADGRVVESAWTPNQIQADSAVLIAALLGAKTGGISYLAVGSGDVSWDAVAPVRPTSQSTLTSEVWRAEILPEGITFVDTEGEPTETQTNRIRFRVTIPREAAVGEALREYALFGGEATDTADTGLMLNWIRNGRIDKDDTFTIIRDVVITVETV